MQAQANFLAKYPGGFADPAMESIKKKHDIDRLSAFCRENLGKAAFNRPEHIVDTLAKIVSRSSMVSRFEKPPFKDFLRILNSVEKQALADAMEQRLHGNKRRGFEQLVGMLGPHKLAKWALVSVVPFYYSPKTEAFVKPTTAKGIVAFLEVEELTYKPLPSWEFYQGYNKLIKAVKREVNSSLAPNNAALTGFLMMSI